MFTSSEVTDYLSEQKKLIFLNTVGLSNNYCKNIPDLNFTKRCRDRRRLLLRRAKRIADQPFLNPKRDAAGGLYFKLRRHLIENFRNALFCKITNNNCRVVLTPIELSDRIPRNVDAMSDSSSSSLPSSCSSKCFLSNTLSLTNLPLPIRILDRSSPEFGYVIDEDIEKDAACDSSLWKA
ncbi:unnamed protein product [Rodentolepis nana]|uniref:SERTA domain-containing protein n=1 Tax=Rodentolepis nana TaxID=102285 RepID=A0A0R3T613_RODNA|nr:unnamed protein product [Rodentolepis nana]